MKYQGMSRYPGQVTSIYVKSPRMSCIFPPKSSEVGKVGKVGKALNFDQIILIDQNPQNLKTPENHKIPKSQNSPKSEISKNA